MFADASAIVAILTREPEAYALADVLERARSPITSPIAIFARCRSKAKISTRPTSAPPRDRAENCGVAAGG
jgi:uncharacterized protein with PIN domain